MNFLPLGIARAYCLILPLELTNLILFDQQSRAATSSEVIGQSVLFGVTCNGAARSGGAGGASGPAGGPAGPVADGAAATEWTGVESD